MVRPGACGETPWAAPTSHPGLEVVNVGQPVGTPQAVILEQLERFSVQVMPAFKRK